MSSQELLNRTGRLLIRKGHLGWLDGAGPAVPAIARTPPPGALRQAWGHPDRGGASMPCLALPSPGWAARRWHPPGGLCPLHQSYRRASLWWQPAKWNSDGWVRQAHSAAMPETWCTLKEMLVFASGQSQSFTRVQQDGPSGPAGCLQGGLSVQCGVVCFQSQSLFSSSFPSTAETFKVSEA